MKRAINTVIEGVKKKDSDNGRKIKSCQDIFVPCLSTPDRNWKSKKKSKESKAGLTS